MSEWMRHREHAEAKARSAAADAYQIVEKMAGWVHTAQLDKPVLDAALEARAAVRKIRNLLNPDVIFEDEEATDRILDELG